MLPVIGALRPWADPVITSIGRMPMASPSPAHASIAEARAADPYDTSPTPWAKSLDGRWKFARRFLQPHYQGPQDLSAPFQCTAEALRARGVEGVDA